jgi:hypothetical protein
MPVLRRRCGSAQTQPNCGDNACRVSTDAVDHRRGHRVKKGQSDEVQHGVYIDKPAVVLRFAVFTEDRKIDPVEARMKPAAPDDIGSRECAAVF